MRTRMQYKTKTKVKAIRRVRGMGEGASRQAGLSRLWSLHETKLDEAVREHCVKASEKYRLALIRAGHLPRRRRLEAAE